MYVFYLLNPAEPYEIKRNINLMTKKSQLESQKSFKFFLFLFLLSLKCKQQSLITADGRMNCIFNQNVAFKFSISCLQNSGEIICCCLFQLDIFKVWFIQ